MKKKKHFKPNVALVTLVIVFFIVVSGISFLGYRLLYSPDFSLEKNVYIYIDRHTDFDKLCSDLVKTANCKRIDDFIFLAEKLHYPENIKTGRYAVDSGMNHLELLNRLRRGQQTAINITFNNARLLEDMADKLDEQLMIDREEILAPLRDPEFCRSQGFEIENVKAMFIPNTYEVYWNISVDNLLQRMKKEYDSFWNEARMKKAKDAGLSPLDVSILASIVEEESAVADEYPVIAGLYINRLKKGMLLQADPTIKYSLGDFSLRRVLDRHKNVDSPYNTYMYAGLPPGPIRLPSIKAIEGVLNFMRHKYIYMCAKEDFSGRHNFAVTLEEHNRNASRYHAELNRRRIR